MKKGRFLLLAAIMVLAQLIVTGCPDDSFDSKDYYTYASIGVSELAAADIKKQNFKEDGTVYSGDKAAQLFNIILENRAPNSDDTIYEGRTYKELVSWLDRYNLPHTIASLAKRNTSAYLFRDSNSYLWAIFAEEETSL
jgi:hypothetical protein